jgi:hypothetical protein
MARLFLVPASRGRAAVGWGLALFVASQLGLGLWLARLHPELRDPEFSSVLAGVRAHIAEAPDRPLVLVLGSSRPANALRPSVVRTALADGEPAPTVCNAALLWGGPLHELLVFRRLLAEGVRPDALLVEVFPPMLTQQGGFSEESFITARGLEWSDGPLVYRYFAQRWGGLWRWVQEGAAPVLCHRARVLEQFAPDFLPRHEGPIVFWPDCGRRDPGEAGWLPTPPRGSDADFQRRVDTAREPMRQALEAFQVRPAADRALRELLDECRRRRIRTALVLMPEHSTLRALYTPTTHARLESYLSRLRQEYELSVFDTRDWVADEDFFDMPHVLPRGAGSFSQRLGHEVLRPWLKGTFCAEPDA